MQLNLPSFQQKSELDTEVDIGYGKPTGTIRLDDDSRTTLRWVSEEDCDRLIKAAVAIKEGIRASRAKAAAPHGRRNIYEGTCQLCGKPEGDELHAETAPTILQCGCEVELPPLPPVTPVLCPLHGHTGTCPEPASPGAVAELAGSIEAGTPLAVTGERVPLAGAQLCDLLLLVGVHVSLPGVRNWTAGQFLQAEDWAAAEHLHASDNDVERLPRPAFLDGDALGEPTTQSLAAERAMRKRLGYDRSAHLTWWENEHPSLGEFPPEPRTEAETLAVIAAYSGDGDRCECAHQRPEHAYYADADAAPAPLECRHPGCGCTRYRAAAPKAQPVPPAVVRGTVERAPSAVTA